MEENTNFQERTFPIFSILYKNLLIIILSAILFALIGFGYSALRVVPTYKASRSVILRTTMVGSTSATEGALAKKYLPTVARLIKSPVVLDEFNNAYENSNERIYKGAIDIIYGEKSLIFTITYTDRTPELAKEKLDVIIKVFSNSDNFKDNVKAEEASIISTQKGCSIQKNTYYTKYTIVGALGGVAISIIAILIVCIMDNTIKSKEEIEEVTGVDLLANINKEKPIKN